jgi:hypothetical protein
MFTSSDLRISFIWTSTILDFLKGTAPANTPMSFLGDDTQYINTFNNSLSSAASRLQPPWFKPREDFFWYYYVEQTQPLNINGAKAWKYLIPLRTKVPFRVTAPWFKGRIFLEGFFYPHGIALVFTAECTEKLSLDKARELSFQVRQDEFFKVTLDDGSVHDLHLNSLAERAMTFLQQTALGPNAKPNYSVSPLFSIWTVVRADGVDATIPMTSGSNVQRILEAVTTWNQNFATANLPDLASTSAKVRKKRSDGDVLYANDRGRAVWFPGTFTLPEGPKRSMACYHRNLVYASMQVESLCRFIRETAAEIKQPGDLAKLPPQQYNNAKRAAGILTRLYVAMKETTYRSGSPYLQIRQNNFLADINKIRQETFAGPPLV